MTSCDECGFVYEDLRAAAISATLGSFAARYREALAGVDEGVASRRPEPSVWSAREYACHVRDVLLIQRDRAVLAQVEDSPSFARMHRDERVALCHYDAKPVEEVLEQLAMAAELCALVFQDLPAATFARRLVYNWPDAAEQDLAWLGRHTVHEGVHHLMDVRRVLDAVASTAGQSAPLPGEASRLLAEGHALRERRRLKEAVLAFEQMLVLDPDSVEAWFWLAVTRDNRGQEEGAIPAYRKALDLGISDSNRRGQAWTWLASSLSKTGRHAEALAALEEADGLGGYQPVAEFTRLRRAIRRRSSRDPT